MKIAVLDIGGTSVKSGLWEDGRLFPGKEYETEASGGGGRLMEKACRILEEMGSFDAIGISTAGQVDRETGSICYANSNIPGYTGMQVRKIMEERFRVPAEVENDVKAAAAGELYYGAGRPLRDFLCLTYGTGIGGAIVTDRRVYRGKNSLAGSFGGIVVHPEDVRQHEDFSGCYEKYASTTALVKAAMAVDPGLTNGKRIFEAFERPEVRGVIDGWIDEIVWGLVTLAYVFDPPALVLGGGIMEQSYVLEEVRKRLSLYLPGQMGDIRVLAAELGNMAGLMGAAALAGERMSKV